jgi:hypothetical protein
VNGKGIIRLIGQLDYERKFLYQLRVMAVDRANNERVSNGVLSHVTLCWKHSALKFLLIYVLMLGIFKNNSLKPSSNYIYHQV